MELIQAGKTLGARVRIKLWCSWWGQSFLPRSHELFDKQKAMYNQSQQFYLFVTSSHF